MKNKVHLTINAWLLFIYLFYFIFIDFTFTLSSFSKLSVCIFMFACACKNSFLKVGYYSKIQKKKTFHYSAWLLFTYVFLFYWLHIHISFILQNMFSPFYICMWVQILGNRYYSLMIFYFIFIIFVFTLVLFFKIVLPPSYICICI
jgi:hypothetical protein